MPKGEASSRSGDVRTIFSFEDVSIEPKPLGGRIPFCYCGATPRSARLAVEFRDGKPRPTIAVIPPTPIERVREEALRHVRQQGGG